jgi:hypothetical protein
VTVTIRDLDRIYLGLWGLISFEASALCCEEIMGVSRVCWEDASYSLETDLRFRGNYDFHLQDDLLLVAVRI